MICRHGNVAEVVSDQGRELQGAFQDLLDRCHIDQRLTSAHHPQSNGLTERFNETLTIALRKMVTEHPEDWDTYLPTILLGYRASIQASTLYSLFFLLHGYEMPLPVRALRQIPMPTADLLDPTAQSILENMVQLHAARSDALTNISKAQDKQRRTYAARTNHGKDTSSTATAAEKCKAVMPPATTTAAETDPVVMSTVKATAAEKGKAVMLPLAIPAANEITYTDAFVLVPPTPDPSLALAPAAAPLSDSVPSSSTSPPPIAVGQYVLVRKHEKVRTSGAKKGKLADKLDGPFLLNAYTDASYQMSILEDSNGMLFKKRSADVCLYHGTS